MTVLVTANANGNLAPPMIVFKYERIPGYISSSVNPKWGIGRSESGWMCGPTFYEYITNIFDPWLDEMKIERPVILFIDGHASHMTLHLSQFCSSKQIELIALYPNSTHLTQPMDVAVFKPLKSYWKNSIRRWRVENNGNKVRKKNFAPIFEQALSQIDSQTVENGFRCSGLFPFNVENVDFRKIAIQQKKIDDPLFSTEEISKGFRILENYIPETILKQFKKNENENDWEDKIKDKSLFAVWKKIKKDSHMNTSNLGNSETVEMDQRDLNLPSILDLSDSQEVIDNETEKDSLEHENYNEVEAEQKTKSKELKTGLEETEVFLPSTEPKRINIISVISLDKSCETAIPTTPKKRTVDLEQKVPTPFKKALFWPEETMKETKRKRKEKIPAVITSKAWQDYHTKKEAEKRRKVEIKEKKSQERQAKKLEKDKKKKKSKQKKLLTSDSESEEQWVESGDSLDDVNLEQENSDDDFGYYKVQAKSRNKQPCHSSYVIVKYEQRYFPGRVTKLDTDGYFISTMTKSGLCDWKWPEQKDEIYYIEEDIMEVIQTPKKKNSRGIYSVPEMAKYTDFSV